HLSHRRRWALPFQYFKIITVIRLGVTSCLKGIAFLQRPGDFFAHRASPRAIGILPRQAIVFPGHAKDSLCVLVHLGTIVFFRGIVMLCLDKTTANLNGVQFVLTDTTIQYFLTSNLGIEKPFPLLLYDRNRKREIIITHQQNGLIPILL